MLHHIDSGTEPSESFSAEVWASRIITINFKCILFSWEYRNKEEHGLSVDEIEIKKKEKLLEERRLDI